MIEEIEIYINLIALSFGKEWPPLQLDEGKTFGYNQLKQLNGCKKDQHNGGRSQNYNPSNEDSQL